jgi:HTH-type transcriptional regulator/antitoxin HipB
MAIELTYGRICSVEELGRLARAHRKNRRQTLERIADLSNVSLRFLSEFERGKETAEIGKVLQALRILGLEVVIQPRAQWNIAQKAAFISARKINPDLSRGEQLPPKFRTPAEDEGN